MTASPEHHRRRGALLGLAVGDALGTTFEFAEIEQPPYPTLATEPATDIVGDGPFGLEPGVVTDDTQLAVCLARSLAENQGFDAGDVAKRYVAWQDEAFDIGNQTRSALWQIEKTGSTAGGMVAWRESGYHAAGNGSLMRTTPIAIALGRATGAAAMDVANLTALIDASIADSLLTHADPRCILACAAHNAAVATAIALPGAVSALERGGAMIEAARGAVVEAARRLTALWTAGVTAAEAGDVTLEAIDIEIADIDDTELALVEAARGELLRDLEMAVASDPDLYGEELHVFETAGFVRVAFRMAFWHAAHTETWRAAVVDVASRGGDSDTNCAIAGALLGARDGDEAIPAAWIERVLAATQPGSATWAEAHHPKHLLALLAE